MRFTRRRSDRHDRARRRRLSGPEALERRSLLSGTPALPFSYYIPTDLNARNPLTHEPVAVSSYAVAATQYPNSELVYNEGKTVSGKDRLGDEWTITVHGPGIVAVQDTTPTDGVLDDEIDSIVLIGTDVHSTYVTGTVVASGRS